MIILRIPKELSRPPGLRFTFDSESKGGVSRMGLEVN